jgi:tRNA modification GTPase
LTPGDETIAAIATAPGGAARGIVRLSGPDAIEAAWQVFRPMSQQQRQDESCGVSRQARVISGNAVLVDLGGAGDLTVERLLPCDLYLWPTARSYTREPVAEFHTLGSLPLLEALLRAVCAAGARLARAGEFTLRAFLAGRLDLVQAEAVLGVIDAADRRELDVALAQLAGGLTRPLVELRGSLLDLLADLEAGLDFVEEDIRFVASGELQRRLAAAVDQVEQLQTRMRARGRTDVEPLVVLVGWPNVGKSSLFNALTGRDGALVSERPGTTRDYLTATLSLGDSACRLVDTAGSEPTADEPIAAAAERLRAAQSEQSRLRLLCLDSTRPPNAWEQNELDRTGSQLVVLTKSDRRDSATKIATLEQTCAIETSSLTGQGLEELRAAILEQLRTDESPGGQTVPATAARCQESLRLAGESLTRAAELAASENGEELIAAELRTALLELGQVAGAVYTDDLLDRIFSRFCIGK